MAGPNIPIFVYVLTDDPQSVSALRVKKYFSAPIFMVSLTTIDVPTGYNQSEEMRDSYKFIWCLKDGRKRNSESFIIVVKDDSITNADPRTVYHIINSMIEGKKKYHICYLTRWQDDCHRHTDQESLDDQISTARTYSPQGLQALLFSPAGRDLILGLKKYKDHSKIEPLQGPLWKTIVEQSNRNLLFLRCIIPNLFNVEVKSQDDYKKLNECLVSNCPTRQELPKESEQFLALPASTAPVAVTTTAIQAQQAWYQRWYFYIFLIVIVILIIWFLWWIIRRYRARKAMKAKIEEI